MLESWVLDTIRADDPSLSWIEERRFDFVPPVHAALEQIIEGATVIIITDDDRAWFQEYILQTINRAKVNRPMISVTSIEGVYRQFDSVKTSEDVDMLEDMLELTYGENYFFWYIGKGDNPRADVAKRSEKNLLWVLDEEVPNALVLPSYDTMLDVKLLHLYRLFDKALNGAMFAEFTL